MKKRSRYLLIGLGFIVFLIVAPLIIIYTSGTLFDFGNKQTKATGIISIQTKPDNADVFLDGIKKTSTPASIRFLEPREYLVRIEKQGYFPWEKRLLVNQGKVTWGSEVLPELHLLKEKVESAVFASNIQDALFLDDTVVALSRDGKTVSLISGSKFESTETITLSAPARNILTTSSNSGLFAFGDNNVQFIDIKNKKATTITKEYGTGQLVDMIDNHTVLLWEKSTKKLFALNIETKAKTNLLGSVSAVSLVDNNMYVLERVSDQELLKLYQLNGDTLGESQIIQTAVPAFQNAELIATRQRQLFLIADGTLFRINEEFEPIAKGITSYSHTINQQSLLFVTASELSHYDFATSSPRLITRFSEPLASPAIREDIGYAFFLQNNEVIALELDTRDRQNRYVLSKLQNGIKLSMRDNGEALLVLDDGNLKVIEIR